MSEELVHHAGGREGSSGDHAAPTQEFGGNMVDRGCPEAMESMSLNCRPECVQCLCQHAK